MLCPLRAVHCVQATAVVGMIGMSYAMVPLYRLFCAVRDACVCARARVGGV